MDLSLFIKNQYQIEGNLKRLPGYEETNYLLDTGSEKYVVKLSSDPKVVRSWKEQFEMLQLLMRSPIAHVVPQSVMSINGDWKCKIDDKYLRILTYLKGEVVQNSPLETELSADIGEKLAVCNQFLRNADLTNFSQSQEVWNLFHADFVEEYLNCIPDFDVRKVAQFYIFHFKAHIKPILRQCRFGLIHSDANLMNLLFDGNKVTGLIDFGDATVAPIINELAIVLTYILMDYPQDGLELTCALISGYVKVHALTSSEIDLLYFLIGARASVSVTMAAKGMIESPENVYQQVSAHDAQDLLKRWIGLNAKGITNLFLKAAGLPLKVNNAPQLLKRRNRVIGQNLSLNFSPDVIAMEQAAFQYMYGSDGISYLDGVNNICHVGHCHPHVVQAGQRQMSLLNTNTRYLYETLPTYCERLLQLLPKELEVVFLVNSGSEANDLALRLARTHTKSQDILVLEGAYHGHTTANIEISPYKYKGNGGFDKRSHVHELAMPDGFRGKYRYDDELAAKKHAEDARLVITSLGEKGKQPAAFISESMLGCGGQIELPQSYLKEMYHVVRAAGGVCIADEVQVGFGRIGTHFWAFESQEVVPDIVVMGKPIANGHPMAAVVCTRAIAESFDNGMEYFNSFGGNPVSCAIGNAVLDVIEQESLQANALKVGSYLLKQWEALQTDFPIIGDVRGRGLFLGLELVKEAGTLEPAAAEAEQLVKFCKSKGVLLSTDGPLHNVIKFKPPMCFSLANANFLTETLRQGLKQLY